jgi:hypothetical protein
VGCLSRGWLIGGGPPVLRVEGVHLPATFASGNGPVGERLLERNRRRAMHLCAEILALRAVRVQFVDVADVRASRVVAFPEIQWPFRCD